MPALQLALLGSCQLSLAGIQVAQFPTAKVQALLAYLAVEAQTPHARDKLIGLFWPEYTTESARQNLRQTLFRLRQVIPPTFLLVTNQNVQFNPASDYRLDVTTFTDLITACHRHPHHDLTTCADCSQRLQQAVELYRGDFLAGFFLDDSPAFEEWLLLKREWLRREALQALSVLTIHHERQGTYAQAQVYAWRQVELDPPREEAHQQLMRVLALSGRRSEALTQYESCRRLLAEELGVMPSAETVTLYEQIRAGELGKKPGAPLPAADQVVLPASAPVSTPAAAPEMPPVSEATIRLVTVLCVGVSDTEEMHPEAAAQSGERLMHLSVPILARYEARLEQGAGAGLMALFGAAQTHEDDPERAVRAAFDVRAAAKTAGLVVSAGVSTGNILLGSSGAPAGPHPFAGSAIQLAVRLQAQAAPGQILVGESTYRQTHAAIQFTPLTLALPGRSSTRTVYQAEQPLVRPQKSRGLTPLHADLVGRTKELAELQGALSAVQAGQGQLVTIIGDAGIGKSRLVTELKQVVDVVSAPEVKRSSPPAAHSTPLLWLEGRCLEMMMPASYWPFLDILYTYLGWQLESAEADRAGSIVMALDDLVAGGQLQAVQREEMGPLLGNLLSVRFGNEWDERLTFAGPEQIRHQTLLTLRDFFVALARQQPLVLVLEDLHWADSLSLDLITLLMEVPAEQPLLLLCVYRPDPHHRCWQLATLATAKCPDSFTEVRLRELTPRQSQQLVEALLIIENLTPRVKETILQKAQGNPLFVEEVIRSLIDAGIVYQQGEVWRAKEEIERIVVPETVQSVILSRVDRLGEALQGVLQRAAVIGRVFGRRLLAQLVPQGIDLDNAVLTLANQAFIYQERVVPEEEYSFKHVLVQEAIYQNTLSERREQFHRQVAEGLEQLYADNLAERYEQLAYHYERSGVVEKAIEYLLKAGEKARRAYLNDEAIGYFQRALERLASHSYDGSQIVCRMEAEQALGQVYYGMSKLTEAEAHLRQALALHQALGSQIRALAKLYYWLGEVLFWQDRYDEMVQLGEAGLARLGDDTECVEAALMNQTIAFGELCRGGNKRFQKFTSHNAQFIEHLPYAEELRQAYLNVVIMYQYDKKVDKALKWLQILEQHGQQHHDLRALAEVFDYRGRILVSIGSIYESIRQVQRGLDLFTKIGDVKFKRNALANIAWRFLKLGEFQKAEDYLNQARGITEDAHIEVMYLDVSHLLLCRGEWEKGVEMLQHAIQRDRAINHPWQGLGPTMNLGWAYLFQGKRLEGLTQFLAVGELITELEARQISLGFIYAELLSGLEVAYQDAEAFRTFCRRFRATLPQLGNASIGQWFLEPVATDTIQELPRQSPGLVHDDFVRSLVPGWIWQDPFGDCTFQVQQGLEIRAAIGRDLWDINLSAPRLLRPASKDFTIQTVCSPLSEVQPGMGGLLLWKNQENYLRLGRGGPVGKHDDILFMGCLGNKGVIIGRGRLPVAYIDEKPPDFADWFRSDPVFLRLERVGQWVKGFCSANSVDWFTVGQTEFPAENSVEVGLYAIGNIDHCIHPAAFPEGMAVHFESFTMYSYE